MKTKKCNMRQLFSVICKQTIIELLLAYSFRKILFIDQNLKHVHVTYSFLERLIFFRLTLVNIYCLEFISHYKEILYINTNFKGRQSSIRSKEDNHERDGNRYTCWLVSDIDFERCCFACLLVCLFLFPCKVKIHDQLVLISLSFIMEFHHHSSMVSWTRF